MTQRFGFIVFTMALFVFSHTQADDFGPRFMNEAPAALSAPDAGPETMSADGVVDAFISMDDMAEQLQNIMPAAGDETEEMKDTQNTPASLSDTQYE